MTGRRRFVGRNIQVRTAGDPPEPVEVIDGDAVHRIAKVERAWCDTGHGGIPARARTWRTRRHRKDFILITVTGVRLHIYLDYAREGAPVWHLVTVDEVE